MIKFVKNQGKHGLDLFGLECVGTDVMAKLARQLFNLSAFLVIAESYTDSVHAGTRCSPDSVQVTLGFVRETEVNDGLHVGNVDAARD